MMILCLAKHEVDIAIVCMMNKNIKYGCTSVTFRAEILQGTRIYAFQQAVGTLT